VIGGIEGGMLMANRTTPRSGTATHDDQTRFERFAHRVSEATGHPTAFALAMLIIVAWAVTGPLFHFNETWQLVINTGTTIVTFLMVFLIQCIQNRDTAALQLKLDELLWAIASADDEMIEVEKRGEHTIEQLRDKLRTLAERSDDSPAAAGGN
jgi:low affinity Fe/Cu permease